MKSLYGKRCDVLRKIIFKRRQIPNCVRSAALFISEADVARRGGLFNCCALQVCARAGPGQLLL